MENFHKNLIALHIVPLVLSYSLVRVEVSLKSHQLLSAVNVLLNSKTNIGKPQKWCSTPDSWHHVGRPGLGCPRDSAIHWTKHYPADIAIKTD